ncbi:MAG: Zn-ribbon domain-containing OB-fold protein [Candidatus Baldrarchaeia archaeon]
MSVPRYWREIPRRYRLIGSKCTNCGRTYFPPRNVCRECGSKRMEEVKLSERGKVITWAVIYDPPRGFEKYVPYIIAIVELDDGTRIMTQITDCEPDEIRIGTRVYAVFRKIREEGESGIIYYGYKFKPLQ